MAYTRRVSRFIRAGAEMRTLPVGGCTLKWTFLMSLNTTSTVMPPTSICLIFMLLEDDLEDALDFINILQNIIECSFDNLLTGLNAAPVIGTGSFYCGINL